MLHEIGNETVIFWIIIICLVYFLFLKGKNGGKGGGSGTGGGAGGNSGTGGGTGTGTGGGTQ